MLKFTFDIDDYYNTEGLYRGETDSPYLAPVFFELKCLVPFFYDLGWYRCSLFSETYGTIRHDKDCTNEKDEDFDISFGINRRKKIIMWLGDLEKLPEKEQKLLLAYNIESDHDITSEFYDAQIKTIWTDPVKELEIFSQKAKINEVFYDKFKLKIFKTEYKDFEDILGKCRKYGKIIFNNKDDFKILTNEWNEELVEDLNVESLKKFLCFKNLSIKNDKGLDLKGIKLFELTIKAALDEEDAVDPYFALYYLRVWSDHKGVKEDFIKALKLISLEEKDSEDYEKIYKTLIEKIVECNNKILGI